MLDNNSFAIGGNLIRKFCTATVKLLAVNMMTLLFSLPLVTAGAACAAMPTCLLKVLSKDDDQIGRIFVHAFRANFKQATLLWIPFLLIFAGALADVFVLLAAPEVLPLGIAIPAVSAAIVAFMIFQYVMPLQARFENSPMNVLKHACILAVSYFPRTVLMTVLWAVPVYCFLKLTVTWPLVLMFGISLPGYFCARLYRPVFWKLEDNMEEQ